jgi:hypothetical protein
MPDGSRDKPQQVAGKAGSGTVRVLPDEEGVHALI